MKKEDGVVFIQIGEVCASKDPVILRTLVGSCVAVCLYDDQNRVGGMSHIVFPGRADPKRVSGATRYAVNALELLINGIMGLGGDRTRLVAKIFGGGAIMPSLNSERYAAGEQKFGN